MKRIFSLRTFKPNTFRSVTLAGPAIQVEFQPGRGVLFVAGAAAGGKFHAGARIGQPYLAGAAKGNSYG